MQRKKQNKKYFKHQPKKWKQFSFCRRHRHINKKRFTFFHRKIFFLLERKKKILKFNKAITLILATAGATEIFPKLK